MSDYYDALETRSAAAREADLFERLPAQVAHARDRTEAFAELLAGVDPAQVRDLSLIHI